jgi:GT2 family glycosyltransferase
MPNPLLATIDVVIVNYNSSRYVSDCLESVYRHLTIPFRIIIVDNNSDEEDLLVVEQLVDEAQLKCYCLLIKSKENLGFGKANNLTIPHLSSPYVLLLNPDTKLVSDVVSPSVDLLERDLSYGCVSPLLVTPNGDCQSNWYQLPSVETTFREYFLRDWKSSLTQLTQSEEFVIPVGGVVGAFMLLRKEVVQRIGLFDPVYFMYVEEVDLCKRIQDSGWRIGIIPSLSLVHVGGCSSSNGLNSSLYFELHKNRIIYASKHFIGSQRLAIVTLVKIGSVLNVLAFLAKALLLKCSIMDVLKSVSSANKIVFFRYSN